MPLPGVRCASATQDELQIAGPYIARYLPEEAPAGCLRVADPDSRRATGWPPATCSAERRGGHLEIVDRIKDIYKNNRGQTIAPRVVESLFDSVPGIKRTFLAGDGRSYNTLLIVPDDEDEVLRSLTGERARHEYFQHIVTTANPDLAAFERVVNFAVLDRDFSADQGELTPKGSYRRKVIETQLRRGDRRAVPVQRRGVLRVGGYEGARSRAGSSATWACSRTPSASDRRGLVNRTRRAPAA